MIAIRTAAVLLALTLMAASPSAQQPDPGLLSNIVTVTVVRLSGVMPDQRMTELENLTTEQRDGTLALRAAVAENVKVKQALAEAGVPDVNAIVGAQISAGGTLTVYVR